MLVVAKFFADVKIPAQLFGILYDLIDNGKLDMDVTRLFVVRKLVIWVSTTVVNVNWILVSRERVPQTEKPPHPLKGFLSVFRNKPLLIYTLTDVVDGIDIGTSESLYYADVLHFNMLPTVGGIPGSPVSYLSYTWAPKFREKYSTKRLWLMQRFSIFVSEAFFLLFGMIGGKTQGLYLKRVPMTIAFGLGNVLEMVFYATKQIVGSEINYEVLDYCEWKNGYRVEATINMINGYFKKLKDILLRIVNGWLLEKWAGYQSGLTASQSIDTMWKMFVASFAPRLVFDFLSMVPMFFYNIDRGTREQMYLELEQRRAAEAARIKAETDERQNQN
jgi:Na+/melibiose symporter-like transporter